MFIVALLMPGHAMAQNVVVDTLQVKNYRINPKVKKPEPATTSNTNAKKVSSKKDKSFMGLMGSLGQGLLNKFKRRFNLEDIKDKVEITKQGLKETLKSKNKEDPKQATPPPNEEKGNQ